MRPRKYPLDPLARLRAKNADDAARLLAGAVRRRQEAERVESEARAQRDAAAKQALEVTEGEREALERGGLRAVDLARAATWSARVESERVTLDDRVARASGRARTAQGGEVSARSDVARAQADAEVVARDRARWEGAAAKKEEAAEEEAAAEAFGGKRR